MGSVLESMGRRGYIEGTYVEPGEGLCICHVLTLAYFATGEYFHMPSWIQSSPGCVQPIDTFLHHPRRVKNVGHYCLTNQEWNVLKDYKFILEVRFVFCNMWGCY